MSWTDLEQRIDRELKAMPAPEAPATLVPNVMRAVAARAAQPAPWWSRAWLAWPRVAQAASIAFVVLAAIAAWRQGPAAWAWVTGAASTTVPTDERLVSVSDFLSRVIVLARVPWQIFQPIASYFALLALAASLTLTAGWYAFTRLSTGGVSFR